MILNLNQGDFQGFGTVTPERGRNAEKPLQDEEHSLSLSQSEVPVFLTNGQIVLSPTEGVVVLSVSLDGEIYRNYWLDKPVLIREGVYFGLDAFKGGATVTFRGAMPPQIDTRTGISMRTDKTFRVEGLYTFFYQEKEQGFLFPGEAHPMCELTYVDKGELHSVVDGTDMLLKQGDLVIYGARQWHMQYSDVGVAPCFVTLSFDVDGLDMEALQNRLFHVPQVVVSLLQNMLQEQKTMDRFSDDMIIAQLKLLLLYLLRETENPTAGKLQRINTVHSENEVIGRAQQYIAEHIREKLSVPLVAKFVGVSPSYLTVLFHKSLKISPGEYIRRIKLQESKQMIRENNLNFTEIASELKYSTVHHFSRQFKEKFGITPTEYAKSVR